MTFTPEKIFQPGFFRRLAAICYDSILLAAVLFVATVLALPLNAGLAFSGEQLFYPAYLLFISFLFFGWFWTHGGQTLGMRAWKIIVLTPDQLPITWKQALFRFFFAIVSWSIIGCGFLWILMNKKKLAWHDSLSRSRLFLVGAVNKGNKRQFT